MHRALRMTLAAVLAVATAPLAGCFVLDELDAGAEIMDAHSPNRSRKSADEKTAAPGSEDEEGKPTRQAWWSQARSLNTGPTEEDAAEDTDPNAIVRCDLGGTTRFMSRGDCLTQGGRLASR